MYETEELLSSRIFKNIWTSLWPEFNFLSADFISVRIASATQFGCVTWGTFWHFGAFVDP
jgi:hypothetical protein